MKILYKLIVGILSIIILATVLINSKITSTYVIHGLEISSKILIPSMFIFLVLSDFIHRTNLLNEVLRPFGFICEKLFKIDSQLASIMIFSLIGGYPAGVNLIANLAREKKISNQTKKKRKKEKQQIKKD